MLKGIEGVNLNASKLNSKNSEEKPVLSSSKERGGESPASQDRVTLGRDEAAVVTYSREVSSEVLSGRYLLLRNLVAKTLQEQGATFSLTINGVDKGIEDLTPEEAQGLVAEDGYFGVEQTSDRIVEFAIAMAGGDPGRLDAILKGVEQGFRDAEQAFGGTLPEISYRTYDAIREKLDHWRENSQS